MIAPCQAVVDIVIQVYFVCTLELDTLFPFLSTLVALSTQGLYTYIQLHRSVGHCNPERSIAVEEKMKVAKRLLIFIPVMFILLRIWCTLQYFYTVYLANIAQNDGQCIPIGFKDGQLILAILQVYIGKR